MRRSTYSRKFMLMTCAAFVTGTGTSYQTASAAGADEAAASLEEVVVTGSRIVREGYEAPTPLTVVGTEDLERNAGASLANILNDMPALTGSNISTSGQSAMAGGASGVQSLNLRSLGATRVLVLLDGKRSVGSTILGVVDTSNFPSQLISRVDIVTGGASAVYGSDAVSGVVNFILDKTYTGAKGEVSGGLTNYGDGKNYRVELSAGFGFAGDRGHVLLSGRHSYNAGVQGDAGRKWNRQGFMAVTNPAYTPTNGQPNQLLLFNSQIATATAGGIIFAGPLKGTAFGPGGTPYQFKYGSFFSNPYMQGGDWESNNLSQYSNIDPKQKGENIFTRVSYNITDSITAYGEYGFSQAQISSRSGWAVYLGTAGPTIKSDNAYIPQSVRAAMSANNLSTIQIGTWNQDIGMWGVETWRATTRATGGLEGSFNAFDTAWSWDANYNYGFTKTSLSSPNAIIRSRFTQAVDAVVSPTTGSIVCRSTLTNPTNGCRPYNVMGTGVNTQEAIDWINYDGQGSYTKGQMQLQTYSASVTGEPFSLWAGPVSVAASVEHRKDQINITVDPETLVAGHLVGNWPRLNGSQKVTEGALETVIPLAKGESWAQAWDFTGAVRFTSYQYAGYVTTYKLGTTYTPTEDIKFRVTRSRDIRAPNLNELFAIANSTTAGPSFLDRFRNDENTQSTTLQTTSGNANLEPEKANTTGIGVVLTPRFLPGVTASVDFWDVNIRGAIQSISGQQVIDLCFTKRNEALCPNIRRDSNGLISQVFTSPINLAKQHARGLDVEASYRVPLSDIMSSLNGNFSLHGLMTFYLRNFADNTFTKPTNRVGENGGGSPPNWKLNVTATYSLDPITASLAMRSFSDGVFDSTRIACTSGCPRSTTDNITVNFNEAPGRMYFDANVSYRVLLGDTASSDLFFSVKNIFNTDPPPLQQGGTAQYYQHMLQSATLYDALGTVYRAGIRFRM